MGGGHQTFGHVHEERQYHVLANLGFTSLTPRLFRGSLQVLTRKKDRLSCEGDLPQRSIRRQGLDVMGVPHLPSERSADGRQLDPLEGHVSSCSPYALKFQVLAAMLIWQNHKPLSLIISGCGQKMRRMRIVQEKIKFALDLREIFGHFPDGSHRRQGLGVVVIYWSADGGRLDPLRTM
ncbi:hypothetical protein PAXRUDRAFT_563565 [Paxillus rubicundulus Ve08.2h10]|uniref:Uncharacterized protein n=1 Tax=Paxillus rubicundulus Ve08.2h10 TaxID=930991 RepID=A0A0D0D6W8_9AGAM|nr:hypothetical protein PAXRUDRAFT_563565 [Paxillus rubicundulus Ve08.2h10]